MRLSIGPTLITGAMTYHDAELNDNAWTVSWLPGRRLNRNEAITAMVVAETMAKNPATRSLGARQVKGYLTELGLAADFTPITGWR